jgi:small subunit ribosomal protein S6
MRIYEEFFIVEPDTPEEQIDAFVEQIKGVITAGGGTVDKVDKWGRRKLAYKINKYTEGYYVLIQFTAPPDPVKEIEHRMRVTDMVLRWVTVRIDEKLKKLAKKTKQREKRAKKRPAPQPVAAPAMPAAVPAMPAAPAAPAPGAPVPAEAEES